jgi:hypothetical protein
VPEVNRTKNTGLFKQFLGLLLAAAILFSVLPSAEVHGQTSAQTQSGSSGSCYIGATFCGNTSAEAEALIDRVKTYTNFFVLQSGPVSKNETAMNEICDYSAAADLPFIVMIGWFDPACPWQIPWLDYAKQRWGNNFLGVYYYDEPGGIQVDFNWSSRFLRYQITNNARYQALGPAIDAYLNNSSPRDYDTAAAVYAEAIANDSGIMLLKEHEIPIFTSEYALYWFTYTGGYDVLLAQLGWNISIAQTIDLARGAAYMQNKTWGVTVTWKYDTWPYLDTGDNIYDQMVMAYDAGAKYITIFNYANDSQGTYSLMQPEHFAALEKLWNYAKTHQPTSTNPDAVLVLPEDYGWGMRRPDDRIWFWGPDENSSKIWDTTQQLLSMYGTKIDIVYDQPGYPVEGKYQHIYYWDKPVNNPATLFVAGFLAGTCIAVPCLTVIAVKRTNRRLHLN